MHNGHRVLCPGGERVVGVLGPQRLRRVRIVAGYAGSRRRNRFPEENVDAMVFGKLLFTEVLPRIGLRSLWKKFAPGQATVISYITVGIFTIISGALGYVVADALRLISEDVSDRLLPVAIR